MNKINIILCGVSVFLLACGSGEGNPITRAKKTMKQASEVVDVVKDVGGAQSVLQKSMSRMQELQGITPVSKQALKAWLPEDIEGFKRKSYSSEDQALGNVSSISASFSHENKENKTFDLSVIDGAGEAGGVFALVYVGQFNRDFEKEHEDGFSKSIEKDNKRAMVSQDNRFNTSELEYLEEDRFYIKISGSNMTVDELWEIASKLRTSNLSEL